MEPPVALLAYDADHAGPRRLLAVCGLLARVAGAAVGAGPRCARSLLDLPSGAVLAHRPARAPDDRRRRADADDRAVVRSDPIALLAEAAGYDDPERWWDDVIESRSRRRGIRGHHRGDGRAARGTGPPAYARDERPRGPARGLHADRPARRCARAALERIVVVCGAWHAPALTDRCPRRGRRRACSRGCRGREGDVTWVPWTHSPAGVRVGLRRGDRLARAGTTTCSPRPTTSCRGG